MNKKILNTIISKATMEDIPERYRPFIDILGIEKFIQLCEYAKGEAVYLPTTGTILIDARNRLIQEEYNGYNIKELSVKYELTRQSIYGIVKSKEIKKTQIEIIQNSNTKLGLNSKKQLYIKSKEEPLNADMRQMNIFDFVK